MTKSASSADASLFADMRKPALARAAAALVDLRNAMDHVRAPHPAYMPGHEPTAADHCEVVLKMMDWNIRQIAVYLGIDLRV